MSTNVVFNGVTYSIPAEGDSNWGTNVSNYLIALASGTLSKSGGLFTLTAELDFGATYGLKTAYVKSRASNPSGTGIFRLGNTESVSWRNAGNSADLALTVNSSNDLTFNGTKIGLSGNIVNADIAAGAAIDLTKLAALTASKVLVSDSSGVISASSVTTTTLGYLDATSSIQTQLNGKEATITQLPINKGGTNSTTALNNNRVMQSSGGAIVEAAAITAARVLISDANGIPTHSTITTTTLGYLDATSSIQTQLNAKEGTITNLPINKGGTNSTTALNNNRIMQSSGGAIVEASAITAARVLISDANGIPTHSTITSTTLGYLDATSSVQTQLNAKEPTISAGTTAQYWRGDKSWQTLDKSAVGLSNVDNTSDATKNAAAVQLTNKDYEGGTASNTSRLTVPKNTKTNLDALTRKEATLVYGSDTDKLYVDDGTNLIEVGSGSGGTVNFITNGDGSAGTTGWTEGSYTAATRPSGTFTASSGAGAFAVATTTTTPLGTGTSSLTFTKSSGANRQGRAIEYSFALGLGYRAKVLTLGVQYIINSGTFVAGANGTDSSMIWYCAFSTDNGSTYTVAEPSTFKMFSNSTTISADYRANIQTPYNATNMKLIAYVAETATTAWEVEAVVNVSPSQYVYGTPITDWKVVTATAGASGTLRGTTTAPSFGTVVTNNFMWRRVGGNMELSWDYRQSAAGTAGSGNYLYDISQLGVSIDTTLAKANASFAAYSDFNDSAVGTFYYKDSGGTGIGVVSVYNATQLKIVMQFNNSAGTTVNAGSIGSTYGALSVVGASGFNIKCSLPILGWSSSVQMSDNAAQSVILASATGTPANVTAGNPIIYPTLIKDTTGSYNTSTGRFTVPTPGFYQVGISGAATVATTVPINIYKNAVQNVSLCFPTTSTGNFAGFNVVECVAGDILDARPVGSSITSFSATTNYNSISFTRISGPNSIGATETVAASYWLSANFAASTTVPINFDSREYDYQGSVQTSSTAWRFTAPVAGLYQVTTTSNITTAVTYSTAIYKNGTIYKGTTYGPSGQVGFGTTLLKLNAGDYIDIRPNGAVTLTGGALNTLFSSNVTITKVGTF